MATMTTPTPPRDLREYDRDGVAGTIHTPDPEAVARLKALMAEQAQRPRTPTEAQRRQHSGDRIIANIQRVTAAVNARRLFVLSDEQMADVEARRIEGESWERIASIYHVSHTTLMRAHERQTRARKRAGLHKENPQ